MRSLLSTNSPYHIKQAVKTLYFIKNCLEAKEPQYDQVLFEKWKIILIMSYKREFSEGMRSRKWVKEKGTIVLNTEFVNSNLTTR